MLLHLKEICLYGNLNKLSSPEIETKLQSNLPMRLKCGAPLTSNKQDPHPNVSCIMYLHTYNVVRKIYLYIDQLSSLHLVFLNVMITAKNGMCSMIMAACLPVALHILDIQICDLYKQFKLHWKLCPSPTLYTLRT